MINWTKEDIKKAYFWSVHLTQDYIKRVQDAKRDKGKKHRLIARKCTYCYYFRTEIVGHGFTTFNCANCQVTTSHPNTGVPKLCNRCADARDLCVKCGGERK